VDSILTMKIKFLINNTLYFHPAKQLLQPVSGEDNTVSLNTPASRCLLLLLQKQGEIVTKEDFFLHVWENKGQYANTNTLYQNISLIRKAFRNVGFDEDVIYTVPREGFSFLGTAILLEDDSNISDDNTVLNTPYSSFSTDSVIVTDHGLSTDSDVKAITNESFTSLTILFVNKILQLIYDNKKMSLMFTFLLTSFLFFSLHLYNLFQRDNDYFSDYQEIGKVNQCAIFKRSSDSLRENDDYLNYFKQKNIYCQPEQKAFIAMDTRGVKVFVHICNKNERDTASCFSNFYIEQKDEK
jgi:DNA-binding winged helix-turn-helix (wHTH) protein